MGRHSSHFGHNNRKKQRTLKQRVAVSHAHVFYDNTSVKWDIQPSNAPVVLLCAWGIFFALLVLTGWVSRAVST